MPTSLPGRCRREVHVRQPLLQRRRSRQGDHACLRILQLGHPRFRHSRSCAPERDRLLQPRRTTTASPGSNHATNGQWRRGGPDWCSAQVHLDRKAGTLWTTCQDNGVLMLKVHARRMAATEQQDDSRHQACRRAERIHASTTGSGDTSGPSSFSLRFARHATIFDLRRFDNRRRVPSFTVLLNTSYYAPIFNCFVKELEDGDPHRTI